MKRTLLLCFLSSLLYVLSQPPFPFFFLSYFCLVPLFFLIDGCASRALWYGIVAGFFTYSGLVYWVIIAMARYGGLNLGVSVLIFSLFALYLSLYTAAFLVSVSFMETRLNVPLYLSAPPLFVIFEYLRGVLLTGFPWSLLAHSHHNVLPLIQVASLTGSYFISFLISSVNGIIFFLAKKQRVPLWFVGSICVLFLFSFLYGVHRLKAKIETPFSCSIVQGNVRQDLKWGEERQLAIAAKYLRLSMREIQADLVVWPETALPFVFEDRTMEREMVERLSSYLNGYLLLGTFSRDREDFYNAAYLFKNGRPVGLYRKVHLVPFGEYTPLFRYLPFKEWIRRHIGELTSGEGHNPLTMESGSLGILICYEGIFPEISRATVKRGAQVLVNITNDAWYDRSSAPFQHLAPYIFRAVETDRFLLRAANTGISAIIDPRGRIVGKTRIFEEAVLRGRFSFRSGTTLYVRHGEWFLLLCLLYLLTVSFGCFLFRLHKSDPSGRACLNET